MCSDLLTLRPVDKAAAAASVWSHSDHFDTQKLVPGYTWRNIAAFALKQTNNKAGTPVLNAWAALGLRGILPVFMIDSGIAAWVVEVRAENQLRLLLPLQWPCFLVCQCLKGIFYHSCSALLCGVAVLSWGWMCFHRAISWYLALENVTLAVVCIVYPICQSPLSVEMELFLLEQCVCVPHTTLPQGLTEHSYVQGQLERSLVTCISVCISVIVYPSCTSPRGNLLHWT